jgi:hypothetical protein
MTYMARDKVYWREPRITNAIIKWIVFWASRGNWFLWADTVVLL